MTCNLNDNLWSSNGKQSIVATMSDCGSNFDALHFFVQELQSDAYDGTSESSGKSSASSCDRPKSRGMPRKRKTTETSTSSQSRGKRLKSSYNDGYRGLFNRTVKEVASPKVSETDKQLRQSAIGVTVWSAEEKEAFFRAVVRRGRQDIRGIATDIGSKSESEVYVYSDRLYKAAVDRQVYGARKNLPDTSKLEVALEIGGECCAALDLAAETLSALQQIEEERAEKKRHQDLALLTPKIARWVERCIVEPERPEEDLLQHIPAARLLNLLNFLTLSKRFFMNSVIADNNWRSYTGRHTRSPSIMHTAFSDFHALSISITQRLVQSSLFFAMSRLKAVSASGFYTPRSHVRRRDVIAALNVLGMKSDAKAFWASVARNCNLHVYDKVRHRQAFGKRYGYVEIEKILSSSVINDPERSHISAKSSSIYTSRNDRTLIGSLASAAEGSISSGSMSIEARRLSALLDEDLSATPLDSTNKQDRKREGHDHLQDAYVEALDQQASRNEECRLWGLLGEDPADKMEAVEVKLPKAPSLHRKDTEDFLDWEDCVAYAGDWETHESPILRGSFANLRGLRKDVESTAGLISAESSSENFVNDKFVEGEHDLDSDEDAVSRV